MSQSTHSRAYRWQFYPISVSVSLLVFLTVSPFNPQSCLRWHFTLSVSVCLSVYLCLSLSRSLSISPFPDLPFSLSLVCPSFSMPDCLCHSLHISLRLSVSASPFPVRPAVCLCTPPPPSLSLFLVIFQSLDYKREKEKQLLIYC